MNKIFDKLFNLGRRRRRQTNRRRARPELDREYLYGTIYVIGDVHGCLDLLLDAERRILEDARDATGRCLVIMLGDYVDRGPDSSGVLDLLARRPFAASECVFLCGNHDAAFSEFVKDPKGNLGWLDFGGRQTLLSYGVEPEDYIRKGRRGLNALQQAMSDAIPQRHLELIRSMPSCLKIGTLLFVHAGIRPGIPLSDQTDEDLLWIREPFLTRGPELPFIVVHGHTPAKEVLVGTRRLGIDTAALATGHLTVLKIKGQRFKLI